MGELNWVKCSEQSPREGADVVICLLDDGYRYYETAVFQRGWYDTSDEMLDEPEYWCLITPPEK